jgi:predicted nucleotidyltransferase
MRPSGAGQSALLLLDAALLLETAGVEYVVIGAMAASVHGVIRASTDADALAFLTVQKAKELERQFRAAGYETLFREGDPDDPIPGLLAVTDAYGNRVDLLIGLRGFDPAALSRAFDVPFHGGRLRVVGLEDFIAMKVFAGGPLDMVDAGAAIAANGKSFDLDLLRQLASRYGRAVAAALETLLSPDG